MNLTTQTPEPVDFLDDDFTPGDLACTLLIMDDGADRSARVYLGAVEADGVRCLWIGRVVILGLNPWRVWREILKFASAIGCDLMVWEAGHRIADAFGECRGFTGASPFPNWSKVWWRAIRR